MSSGGARVPIWLIILAPIVLIMVACFFLSLIRNGYHAALLLGGHETAAATVTASGFHRNPSSYVFTVDGSTYYGRGHQEVAGDVIEVAYLRDNPRVNRPADDLWFDAIFGAGIVLVVPGMITWEVMRSKSRSGAASV